MNKIFKVIWCKSSQTWIAVSELCKMKPISSATQTERKSSHTLFSQLTKFSALSTLLLIQYSANAYVAIGATNNSGYAVSTGATAIYDLQEDGTPPYNYMNPGSKSYANKDAPNSGDQTLYYDGNATGIAIGNNTNALNKDNASNGIAIGDYSRATGGLAMSLGSFSTADSNGAVAIGTSSRASGVNSLSMMRQSSATGDYSTAIGSVAWSAGQSSFALGASATAKGNQSIAIGSLEQKKSADGLGTPITKYNGLDNTQTNGDRSMALGTNAKTNGDDSFAIGYKARTGEFNTVMDSYLGENVMSADSTKKANKAIAVGTNTLAQKESSIALGYEANSLGMNAISIGANAKAEHDNVVAIGQTATATKSGSMAIGQGAQSTFKNSLALGTGTIVNNVDGGKSKFTAQDYNVENGVISIANVGKERRIINLAAGRNDTDAVNVAQLQYVNKNLAKSIGGDNYTGYSDADNHNYKAPEFDIKNTQYNNVKAAVEAAQTNYVSVNSTNKANDSNYDNKGAKGSGSIALGDTTSTDAAATNSIAIGLRTSVTGSNTVAIGAGITAATSGSVVLGDSSSTEGSHPTANVNSATVNGHTYNGFAGTVKGAGHFMSVGSKGTERQIKNVAAGHVAADSTDAINGSQLFSVASRIEQGWNISSEAAANGTVSGTNAAQTIKPGSAVKLLAGKNLNINQDGSNFTFSTKENVSFENITTQNLTATGNTSVKNFTVQNGGTVNMGNNRVTGVASPTDGTDAVNKQYVDNLKFKYVADNSTKGENLLSAETHFLGKADEIVTKAENGKVSFALADKAKASLAKADTAMQDFIVGADTAHNASGISLNQTNKRFDVVGVNDVATKVNGNSIEVDLAQTTKTTITKHTTDIADNKQKITDNAGNIATNTAEIAKGFGLEAQDGGHVNKKLGQNVKVVGGNNNINTSVSNGEVKINLSNTLDLGNSGSVTIGDTLLNNNGLAITNGPKLTQAGIDAGNKKITDVADGNVAAGSKEAVNGGQLFTETTKAKTTVEKGDENIQITSETATDGHTNYKVALKPSLTVGPQANGHPITINGNDGHITGLTNKNWTGTPTSGRAATEDQLSVVDKKFDNKVSLGGDSGSTTEKALSNTGGIKFNIKGGDSQKYVTTIASGDDITVDLTQTTKDKIDNAADKNLSNITNDGKKAITALGSIVEAADGTITVTDETDNVTGKKTYKIKANIPQPEKTAMAAGKNTVVDGDGSAANPFKVDLKDNLELGQKDAGGVTGKDSSIKVNGKDGSSVAINGKDGSITLNGKDGTNPVTLKTTQGPAGLNGTVPKDRLIVNNEAVATLQDGLQFAGDNGDNEVIRKTLNQKLDIVGGADKTKLSDNNIGVNANNGKLEVKLAKELNDLTSAQFKNGDNTTVINGSGMTITPKDPTKVVSLTDKGLNNGGNQIVNIDSGLKQDDGSTVALKEATGDTLKNAVNVGDLKESINDITDATKNGGFGLSDDNGTTAKANLGETVKVKGDGSVVTKVVTDNGKPTLQVGLAKDITVGDNTNPGTITVKGENGKDGVSINGKDGAITLNGKDGTNPVTLKTTQGPAGLNGTVPKDRLIVNNEAVATLQDGLQFAGDNGDNEVIRKTLNQKLDIVGGADKTKLSDNNIGVNANNGKLEVKLAKELNDLTSAQFKNGDNTTVINGSGMTITPKDPTKVVSLTDKGLNNGGNQIVNIDSGLKQDDGSTVALKEATGDTLKNAVNVGDLKESINDITDATKNGGFGLSDDNGTTAKANLGETVKVKGDGSVVTKVVTDNGKPTLQVGLAKDITVGDNTNPGTITVKGENGKDGVSINGKDGSIGLNGKDGANASITVAQGKAGVDGKDGESKTRITYEITNPDGSKTPEQVATLNDGMKFVGNDGKVVTRKLNDTLSITGGINNPTVLADNQQVSGNNIGVRYKDQGGLEVVMKERPEFSGVVVNGKDGKDASVTFAKDGKGGMSLAGSRDAEGKDAITIKGKDGKDGVSFKDDGRITNVADGVDDKDAVNKSQLDKGIAQATSRVDAGKNITVTPQKNADGSTTYTVETKDDVEFTSVKSGDTTMDNNGISITGGPSVTKDGINANDKKITGVQDGDISATSKDAVNGSQLHQTNQNVNNLTTTVNKGLNFQGDNQEVTVNRKLGDQLNIRGGANPKKLTQNNIGVVADKNGTMTVQMAKDVNLGPDGSLTVGNTTVNNDGVAIKGGPSMTQSGINAGGKRISNVARGKAPNDAVNMSQLQETSNAINNRIDNIDNRVNKMDKRRKAGTASALATAGLMQPHRDGQSALVAAVGQYQSETAVAVGYSRISDNGKYGVKVSFSTNSQGEVGGTAGAGYFW